jgi:hypothetical protein
LLKEMSFFPSNARAFEQNYRSRGVNLDRPFGHKTLRETIL